MTKNKTTKVIKIPLARRDLMTLAFTLEEVNDPRAKELKHMIVRLAMETEPFAQFDLRVTVNS